MDQSDFELLEKLRESAREDLRYFSNGRKEDRERWVISEFLALRKVQFSTEELQCHDQHSKVDVEFRKARFQIKEIMNLEPKRHAEASARYKCLMEAKSLQDIVWPMFGYDLPPIITIYSLVSNKASSLSSDKRYVAEKNNIDLMFYVTRTRASLIKKEEIDREYLSSLGWRSISCLAGKQAIVLFSAPNAPDFLEAFQNSD